MKVGIVCFGAMRDYLPAGTTGNRAELDIPDGSRVVDVVERLGAPHRLVFSLLVDGTRADLNEMLEDGAEVTLMPPFSGGGIV